MAHNHIIEDGIPLPGSTSERSSKWPFSEMKVGQSILVEGKRADALCCKGYSAAFRAGRLYNMKFAGRSAGDGKVRIWRVQ
jgi:hypothetical protein